MRCVKLNNYRSVRDALSNKNLTAENAFRRSRLIFGKTTLDSEDAHHFARRTDIINILDDQGLKDIEQRVIVPIIDEAGAYLLRDYDGISINLFILQVPLKVICILIGLPVEKYLDAYHMLRPIIRCLDDPRENLGVALDARKRINCLINSSAQHSKISKLMLNTSDIDGRLEYESYMSLLLAAGSETTILALSNLIFCLSVFHETNSHRNIKSIIKETLRLEPPLRKTIRYARKDTRINGVRIQKDSQVELDIYCANRDPEVFVEPDCWNPGRESLPIMTFGFGRHGCPGSKLALLELRCVCDFLLSNWSSLTRLGKIPSASIKNPPNGIVFRRAPWFDIS